MPIKPTVEMLVIVAARMECVSYDGVFEIVRTRI